MQCLKLLVRFVNWLFSAVMLTEQWSTSVCLQCSLLWNILHLGTCMEILWLIKKTLIFFLLYWNSDSNKKSISDIDLKMCFWGWITCFGKFSWNIKAKNVKRPLNVMTDSISASLGMGLKTLNLVLPLNLFSKTTNTMWLWQQQFIFNIPSSF